MEVTINNKKIEINFSFRSDIIFENISGNTFTGKTETEWITYLYSNIVSKDNSIEFDLFMDWLDENPLELTNFINAYIDRLKTMQLLLSKKEEDIESKETF